MQATARDSALHMQCYPNKTYQGTALEVADQTHCAVNGMLAHQRHGLTRQQLLSKIASGSPRRCRRVGCRGTAFLRTPWDSQLRGRPAQPAPASAVKRRLFCTLIKQQCYDQSARPIVPEAELPGAECGMPNLAARHNESMRRVGSTGAPTCSRALYSACACACSACCCRCMASAADICCGGGPAFIMRPCSQASGLTSYLIRSHAVATSLMGERHHLREQDPELLQEFKDSSECAPHRSLARPAGCQMPARARSRRGRAARPGPPSPWLEARPPRPPTAPAPPCGRPAAASALKCASLAPVSACRIRVCARICLMHCSPACRHENAAGCVFGLTYIGKMRPDVSSLRPGFLVRA